MIACINFYSPEVLELVQSDIPIITIDHLFDSRCAIVSDNVKGMHDLMHYIYEMGHRKIAYIHGADSAVTRARVSSFYRTCEELDIDVPDEYVKEAAYRDTKSTCTVTKELLQLKERPTCILYPDDFACFGGINAIKEMGLKIPDDISVAGYDGLNIARHIEPQMTTLWQDTKQIGTKAAEKLISLIENPRSTLIEQIVVGGEVFKGRSVAKLN